MTDPMPLGVYVHWPYCARICPYCDFNVVKARGGEEPAALARAIVADLEAQAELTGPRELVSIFLGGGTPSLMDPAWAAEIVAAAWKIGARHGVLVTVPVPVADELAPEKMESAIRTATAEGDAQGVHGKAATPFLRMGSKA